MRARACRKVDPATRKQEREQQCMRQNGETARNEQANKQKRSMQKMTPQQSMTSSRTRVRAATTRATVHLSTSTNIFPPEHPGAEFLGGPPIPGKITPQT